MSPTRKLLFVSPRFLFPTDSGGKIRTTQILRGMKGGRFHITLVMPATRDQQLTYASQVESTCDRLLAWRARRPAGTLIRRIRHTLLLASREPVSVASDRNWAGMRTVCRAVEERPDVVVFDFAHSAVLSPPRLTVPSIMFTHNVESEIARRHYEVARSPLRRLIWRSQFYKMLRFEGQVLRSFNGVIAVSDRDCSFFRRELGVRHCHTIPTGVDTGFFAYGPPGAEPSVVFCGSMDWLANIDAVEYFHDDVWPLIRARVPQARMKVVGRTPPDSLVRRIGAVSTDWQFTGFVEDVREHVRGAAVFVIPLRVGGGTRIKVFEAMSMGTPVVSTAIGVEGLPIVDGSHYLRADEPVTLARSVADLLLDPDRRNRISLEARRCVEETFGLDRVVQTFEQICIEAMSTSRDTRH